MRNRGYFRRPKRSTATGGRRGELLGLIWDRVDFEQSRVHFAITKGHKDRFVPVNEDVIQVLRKLQAQTLRDGGPFADMDKPTQRRWDSVLAASEVSGLAPHDLRRTYVTRLVRAGVPLPTVQKLAGHADIKFEFRTYAACWAACSRVRVSFREPRPRRGVDKTSSLMLSRLSVISMSANEAWPFVVYQERFGGWS